MKRLPGILFSVVLAMSALTARAELTIEISQGSDNPTAIAVVPFAWQGTGAPPEDIAAVVDGDLARSGQFAPVARTDMLGRPTTEVDVFYRDWRSINAEYLLIGRVSAPAASALRVDYELFDVLRQKNILTGYESGPVGDARMLAHRVADAVYEKLTGVPGAFATKLLYISVARVPGGKDYSRLTMSDSDGARPIVLLETQEPLLGPTWAPDGKNIAYVSFESGRPAIYRQELASGARTQLTNFKGLNSSPAWSPDGRSMAMVLSKDGNPDIYLMDLATKQLRQLTRHYAIDTEPAWMPDGQSLLFTSDRGGKPQIYRYDLRSGKTLERHTVAVVFGDMVVVYHHVFGSEGDDSHCIGIDGVTGDIQVVSVGRYALLAMANVVIHDNRVFAPRPNPATSPSRVPVYLGRLHS